MKFSCKQCGNCCRGAGYVYLTGEDIVRLAESFDLLSSEFVKRFCETVASKIVVGGHKRECRFLLGNKCFVYAARPEQCRTWPFWKENIRDGEFTIAVKERCEGCV